jgi:hypothetical protein
MSLQLQQTTTVSSNTASVTLTGVDTANVYMLVVQGLIFQTNDDVRLRITSSGSPITSSDYDFRHKTIYADTSIGSTITNNNSNIDLSQGIGTSMNFAFNMIAYLHNFNNANEYSYIVYENIHRNTSQGRMGAFHGGAIVDSAGTHDGIQIFGGNGNDIAAGSFSLYKINQ